MKSCSVTGCDNKYVAKGFCSTHRKINKKYGTSTPTCWCGEFSQTSTGNIIYSEIINADKNIILYRYEYPNGTIGYFTPEGKSIEKSNGLFPIWLPSL